jgi:hypothetical protein
MKIIKESKDSNGGVLSLKIAYIIEYNCEMWRDAKICSSKEEALEEYNWLKNLYDELGRRVK